MVRGALIFLGAGTGGLLRFWLGGLVQGWLGPQFPFGTLVVNVTGCLVMGFLATMWGGGVPGTVPVRDEIKAAILVGALGGYTTFSSFSLESLSLAQHGEWGRAGLYVVASVVLSLAAVWVGAMLAERVLGASTP